MSRPRVSIVVPMLDEVDAVGDCLEGFAAQTYRIEDLEVLVVDGGSTDGSRELVEAWADRVPWVRVVDNPARRASAAFNRGVEAATGDVVCLFSAHGVPDKHYVERSVGVLDATGAAGVGGVVRHEGGTPVATAIGLAMQSPFGMASPARFASGRRTVDTLLHPAYRRDALLTVGPFDEGLERNSDYELNFRLRELGEELVFDPGITSAYHPRADLARLARQFRDYGWWKARVIARHPSSAKPRHFVAPAAVVGAALSPFAWRRTWPRRAVVAGVVAYACGVAAATADIVRRSPSAPVATVAVSFPVMHGAWGGGFVASVIALVRER